MGRETKRQRYERLRMALEAERSSFVTHWRDICDHLMPTRPRWIASDHNRGERRNQKIKDSTPVFAHNTLTSGLMAGVTSPSRPWFRLTLPNRTLLERPGVKAWLYEVMQAMSDVFSRSGIYDTLRQVYDDFGGIGTAAAFIEEDPDTVIRGTAMPIGSYMIAQDARQRVNVFFREFRMTVRQVVTEFGTFDAAGNVADWRRFSLFVKRAWERGGGDLEQWVDVCHVIEPNHEHRPDRMGGSWKRWASCYYEKGAQGRLQESDAYLSEGGFDYFPVVSPRWSLSGGDVYATNCPGMVALGDIKQLQHGETREMEAIDKMVRPPLNVPERLRKKGGATLLPGDMNFHEDSKDAPKVTPVFQVEPRVDILEHKQQQVRQRIERGFFVDLFRMFSQIDREMTATEVAERQQEKLLAVGPVLERLNKDLLDPLIDITFGIMERQGLIPPPPEEIADQPLKVEYISIMAQAQRAVGIAGIERLTSYALNAAGVTKDPSLLDKLNFDEALDELAENLGTPPAVTRSDDEVAALRQERAAAQEKAAATEEVREAAAAAKDLSQANLDEDSALSAVLRGAEGAA